MTLDPARATVFVDFYHILNSKISRLRYTLLAMIILSELAVVYNMGYDSGGDNRKRTKLFKLHHVHIS